MSDHQDLLAELAMVEKMSTQERLKHSRKRRTQQLKRFVQYEKQLEKDVKNNTKRQKKGLSRIIETKRTTSNKHVMFVSSVMLLEAAARNDIDEGESVIARLMRIRAV